jgi:cobalt-zinc-cadmium efflux system outer membrane protein
VPDDPPPIDLALLAGAVRNGHPALIAADREIDAAAARLDRARAERTSDLDVRFGAGYDGAAEEGIFEVGAGMALPLWDGRRGEILAARFDLMRARQQRAATEADLLRAITEAHGAYESARGPLETVRERLVPAALRSYEQTLEAYRGGRAAFFELLDAQRTLAEARVTLIELSGAAAVARAAIMQVAGGAIPPAAAPALETASSSQPPRAEITP